MNSLAFLSRQFDSRFRPQRQPQQDAESPIHRVPTWSAFPPFKHLSPKRSSSSPALFSPNVPSHSAHSKPKSNIESLLRRVFFIRVFILVWNRLTQAWSSLIVQLSLIYRPPARPYIVHLGIPSDHLKDAAAVHRFTIDPDQAQPALTRVTPEPPTTAEAVDDSSSRATTPPFSARKAGIHQLKTLVLDLDETLIHSTSRPMDASSSDGLFGLFGKRNSSAGHTVEVVLQDKSTLYHVYKRPFVDFFLRTVSGWYTLVIFTASMQEYADPVIDWLDAGRGILVQRFFRDSCTQLPNGSYTKDLSIVDSDLSRVCLVDNSPISYKVNEANGIPIEGWTHDPSDEALLDLLPVLDSLRFTSDVRRVLGLRTAGLYKPAAS